MAKCQLCGKGKMFGHRVSHAKNRVKRAFKPNLHRANIIIEGKKKKMLLCTKCLRKMKKEMVKTPKVAS